MISEMLTYAAMHTIVELERHGFPELFSRIARRDVPPELTWLIQPVDSFYALATARSEGGAGMDGYLPLWEEKSDTVVAYDTRRGIYVRHYFFDRDLGEVVLGVNYQQFVAAILLDLVDTGITDLTDLAKQFQFEHLPELTEFLETVNDHDVAATNRGFVATLGSGSERREPGVG